MTSVAPTSTPHGVAALWDPDGRRVPGGPLAPDPPALEGADELSFGDILSIVNPLQHIPVVSSIYRWITGDEIKPAARVIGGALYGGPIGLVSAALSAVVEQVKGADLGEQVIAALQGDPAPKADDAPAPQFGANGMPGPEAEDGAATAQASAAIPAMAVTDRPVPASSLAPSANADGARARPTHGRDLAFYQANAGRRLAPVELGRDRVPHDRAIPAHAPPVALPAAFDPSGAKERQSGDGPRPPEGPPSAWFSGAMLRGLDRYRAMQALDAARPALDVSH